MFGLPALNAFWLCFGAIFIPMNLSAAGDCRGSLESFVGIERDCEGAEAGMTKIMDLLLVGWLATIMVLALQPRVFVRADKSFDAVATLSALNCWTMRVTLVVYTLVSLIICLEATLTPVAEADGDVFAPTATVAFFYVLPLCVAWPLAIFKHTEPVTESRLFENRALAPSGPVTTAAALHAEKFANADLRTAIQALEEENECLREYMEYPGRRSSLTSLPSTPR